ncbi:hypothetical protein BRADI_3g44993v3 [Brachypodium distachyon]|uniref:Uncharacterized protein n=1 Tax=Brachypodium distachyon TaxID=15368 RepID=A0A2K2D390_BRADI|nr:hypothetical protein BRADI_3g44993v3 [Brachypodium distachyon]
MRCLCMLKNMHKSLKPEALKLGNFCRVHSNGAFPFTKIRRHIFLQRERKRLRETGAS